MINSEATTITALINPFLQILGYDVSNPAQIVREYDADTRLKKGNKVDIAIIKNNKPIVFIECKKVGENITIQNVIGQLNSYFVAVPEVCFGIITNGIEYSFYQESQEKSNTMDLKPFLEIDLSKKILSSQLDTLLKFNQSNFDMDELSKSIGNLKAENFIRKFMTNLVTEELSPDNELTNILIKETPYRNARVEKRKEFASLASKIIRQWLDDMIREKINNIAKKQEEEIESTRGEEEPKGIVTTEEEIQAYYIIKAICAEKVKVEDIAYQDYLGFFSIYFAGKKTKYICKLYLTDQKKEIEIFDKKEPINSIDDLYSFREQLFQKLDMLCKG